MKIIVESYNNLKENLEMLNDFFKDKENITINSSRMIMREKRYQVINIFDESINVSLSLLINVDEYTIQVTMSLSNKTIVKEFEKELRSIDLKKMYNQLKVNWNW